MKITVTDDRGRSASYELPDDVGRKFVTNEALSRPTHWSTWHHGGTPATRLSGAVWLAALDVFEEKPVQVGHLATTPGGVEVLVRHIDDDFTFYFWSDGSPGVYANGSLTYSRPKPEGWGQQ